MNFVPALPTAAWIALGLVPVAIVLLYFLKLRRQPLTVPSTYLWERTIEDLHVNSLMQRLRSNLLLFLQLLFVALAALALLRPGWEGVSGEGRRLIFLLDASASMAASDVEGAATRFELAKQRIAEQIEGMGGDDVAMLIAFSDRSDVLQEFTDNRRRLREALDQATVTSRPTNMLEALRAAAGLANPIRTSQAEDVNDIQVADPLPADLFIVSDGGFEPLNEFSLGNLAPTFLSIGSSAPQNVAITAFSAERNLENPAQVQAFARIANFGAEDVTTTATLTLAGELVDAQNVDLEAGEEAGLTFQLENVSAEVLRLALEADDDLAVDNVAYAGLTPMRSVSVLLVTPGNTPLELATETEQASQLGQYEVRAPDYLATEEFKRRAAVGQDDLILFDRCAPEEMPASNTFFIGSLPPEGWSAGEMTGPVLPIDIDRTHPIMRYLELFSLRIVEGRALEPPRGAVNLITADIGPVLSLAPREGFQDLVMGFDIISQTAEGESAFNIDWPIQRSWPVFIFNALRHLGGAIDTASAMSIRPGETATLRVDNRLHEVRVVPPEGDAERVAVGPAGVIPYAATDQIGVYRVLAPEGDSAISVFTVNLFDSRESNIAAAESIDVGYEEIARSEATAPKRSELWRWMLLAALGVLVLEWVVFNRRLA